MSCINYFGTARVSASLLSRHHEFSLWNPTLIKRGIPVLPRSFSAFDKLTTDKGKSTAQVQMRRKYLQSVCQVQHKDPDGNLSGDDTILDEEALQRELQIAIEDENYAQAAKIRDSLRFLQEDSRASVLAANNHFYNCFRKGDLGAMQALWAKRDNVCCVHPGVSGISGYDLVMGSWGFVCAEYVFPIDIEVKDVEVYVKGDIGYVTCIEMVKNKGTTNWGRQFATNVFEKIDGQWFICIHHASNIDL